MLKTIDNIFQTVRAGLRAVTKEQVKLVEDSLVPVTPDEIYVCRIRSQRAKRAYTMAIYWMEEAEEACALYRKISSSNGINKGLHRKMVEYAQQRHIEMHALADLAAGFAYIVCRAEGGGLPWQFNRVALRQGWVLVTSPRDTGGEEECMMDDLVTMDKSITERVQ